MLRYSYFYKQASRHIVNPNKANFSFFSIPLHFPIFILFQKRLFLIHQILSRHVPLGYGLLVSSLFPEKNRRECIVEEDVGLECSFFLPFFEDTNCIEMV